MQGIGQRIAQDLSLTDHQGEEDEEGLDLDQVIKEQTLGLRF